VTQDETRYWEYPLDLNAPDEELGRALLGMRLITEASKRGINLDQITDDLAKAWIEQMKQQEASDEDVRNIPLEKATRLAANGEWARAGKMFRAFVRSGQLSIATARLLVEEHAKRVEGGKKRGDQIKAEAGKFAAKVVTKRQELIDKGTAPHNIASKLGNYFNKAPRVIRKILKKADSS